MGNTSLQGGWRHNLVVKKSELKIPPSIRISTASLCPTMAAFKRGVIPSSPVASTSAPVSLHAEYITINIASSDVVCQGLLNSYCD